MKCNICGKHKLHELPMHIPVIDSCNCEPAEPVAANYELASRNIDRATNCHSLEMEQAPAVEPQKLEPINPAGGCGWDEWPEESFDIDRNCQCSSLDNHTFCPVHGEKADIVAYRAKHPEWFKKVEPEAGSPRPEMPPALDRVTLAEHFAHEYAYNLHPDEAALTALFLKYYNQCTSRFTVAASVQQPALHLPVNDITAPWKDWPTEHLLRKIEMPEGFVAELRKRLNGPTVPALALPEAQPTPASTAPGWPTIDSAPKDGTHILAADFTPGKVGFGGNPPQAYYCVVHWFQWCDGTHPEETGWYPSTGAGDSNPMTNLTNWQPLTNKSASLAAPPAPHKEGE